MARRRRPLYNQTLGGDWKKGLSAHEINIRDSNGNLLDEDKGEDYNQAAANQYRSVENARLAAVSRDNQTAIDKTTQDTNFKALASSLGVKLAPTKDVWNEQTQRYDRPKATNPNFDQLKSQFYSLPQDQQVKIYKQGGARFIDGAEGAKMIQGFAKSQDEAMNSAITAIVGQIARGDLVHDPSDRKFYRTIKDPNDPLGQKTLRVPISQLEGTYVKAAMDRGMMPDIDKIKGAVPSASPTTGPGLADTKTIPENGLERPRPMFGPPASMAGPFPSQVDTATRLGAGLRSQFTGGGPSILSSVENRVNDFAQTFPGDVRNAGAHIVNALSGGVNAVTRFQNALLNVPSDGSEIPQIPYETVTSNLLAQPNRQAATQSAIASSLAQPPAPVDPMTAMRSRVQSQVPAGPDQQAYMDWIDEQRIKGINSNLATTDY